jgi:ureidoglycolate amidohydrolase
MVWRIGKETGKISHLQGLEQVSIEIETDRLSDELERLASYSDLPAPALSRIVFSEQDLLARSYVRRLCEEAGLVVHVDPVGNTFARWAGSDAEAPAVATGSHIDAIPNSGRFDGTVGVLGGLEAIRALRRSGFRPKRSLELVIFTSEEPTRFGLGCLGSRLMVGTLDEACGTRLKDSAGRTLDEVRASAGFVGPLSAVRRATGSYSGFVELHIEQGPILEREEIPIGIVTAIAAPATLRVSLEGEGGHAGGVLMPNRRDALCAAAEIVLSVERAAKSSGSIDSVATVGICNVFPGAVNSIPSRVHLEIDVRDTDQARRDVLLHAIVDLCQSVRRERGVSAHAEILNSDAPAVCDSTIVEALTKACEIQHLRFQRMVSRAYHDSLFMSRIAPAAMLFIPCRGGVSHRPDEYASPEAIANGTLVLANTLASLSHA